MAKLKTHKGLKKRLKVTGTGKLIRKFAGAGAHNRAKKPAKYKIKRRKEFAVSNNMIRKLKSYL